MPSWVERSGLLGFREIKIVPDHTEQVFRFAMLVCGMFCSIVIGAIYAFSLITDTLTNDYNFSQNDITTISTVGIVIGYLTFPFGILYDYYGPKPVFFIGIVCNIVGTLLFAFTFNNTIGHSVVGLAFINAVMNLGTALFDMGTVITVLSWFPLDRGYIVGCMKTMTGMGGSFLSTLYGAYFNNNNTTYMYFLLIIATVIGTIAMIIFYLPPYHMTGRREKVYTEVDHRRARQYESVYVRQKAPIKRFIVLFVLVIALLIVISTRAIVFVYIDHPTSAQQNPPTVIMIVLYALLCVAILPIK